MLKILRQRMAVQLSPEQAREIGSRMAEKYAPLISGIKREYWRKIGLPSASEELWASSQDTCSGTLSSGELYLVDSDTILYYKQQKDKDTIEAGAITRQDPASYADFFVALRNNVRAVTDLPADWEPVGKKSHPAEEGAAPTLRPDKQEVEAAQELEADLSRDLLATIIQRNSVFLNKLTENRDKPVVERAIQRFEKLGMIGRDYAVLCSKTGQQILRVTSRDAIEDPSHKTFKCFVCGKPISEETVDEIITSTDYGKKLLEGDYWLLVRVMGAIQRLGIAEEDVSLDTDDGGMSNLFVDINQEAYLFVLANRKLGLNEAYIISAHVSAFDLNHVVVVSNERISNLMRYHLEKTNPDCSFNMVESLPGLEEKFESILRDKEKQTLRETLDAFASLTPVRVQDLILQRIAPESNFTPEQLSESRAEAPVATRSRSKKPVSAVAAAPKATPAPAPEEAPVPPLAEEDSFFVGEEALPEAEEA